MLTRTRGTRRITFSLVHVALVSMPPHVLPDLCLGFCDLFWVRVNWRWRLMPAGAWSTVFFIDSQEIHGPGRGSWTEVRARNGVIHCTHQVPAGTDHFGWEYGARAVSGRGVIATRRKWPYILYIYQTVRHKAHVHHLTQFTRSSSMSQNSLL